MAKKHKDSWPVIEVTCVPKAHSLRDNTNWEREFAQRRGEEMVALIKRHCIPHFSEQADIDLRIISKHVCEHCGYDWTEKSNTYNGGCCDTDEAGNPELQVAS